MIYPRTTEALIELLAPHVDAKRRTVQYGPRREVIRTPRTHAIDIKRMGSNSVDIDMTGVGPVGVERFFYSTVETFAWADIKLVTIATLDERGERASEVHYMPVGSAMQVAA